MDLKRFFSKEIDEEFITLTGEEFFHAVVVTRHKKGYKLVISNENIDYFCTVVEIGKDFLKAKIDKKEKNSVESDKSLVLYIGVNKDLDAVVRHAVELGVKKIVPFCSQHTNVKEINTERFKRIVIESCKQCGRAYIPTMTDMVTFDEVLCELKPENTVFFYEYERDKLLSNTNFVDATQENINVVIGGEGGFSIEEIEKVREKGINTYSLGKRILRVATAVDCAIALCMYLCGEM